MSCTLWNATAGAAFAVALTPGGGGGGEREDIVAGDSGDLGDWSALAPVRKRGGTSGKGSSNCSKGGGCARWGGKGVLFVFVF